MTNELQKEIKNQYAVDLANQLKDNRTFNYYVDMGKIPSPAEAKKAGRDDDFYATFKDAIKYAAIQKGGGSLQGDIIKGAQKEGF